MANFNDLSHKGTVLMHQALKKYGEGDFEGGDKDREEANRYFDLASREINSEEGKLTQLYGESRNFGVIYNVIEQNMDGNVHSDEKTKKLMREAYKTIKSDNLLTEQFKVYDLFEKARDVEDVEKFVSESISLVKNHDRKEIMESNGKLINIIKKMNLDEYVDIPEELENLYEAVEYIILNKKSLDNVKDYIKAKDTIVEYVTKSQKDAVNESRKSNEEIYGNFVNELESEQDKIDENINDDERKLLETFTNPKVNHRKVFEEYKRNTLAKINEAMETSDDEDKEGWKEMYESVKAKEYSENVNENIVNCAEMLETCATLEE